MQAAAPAALSTQIAALEAAYSLQGQDISLCFDDGSPSRHRLLSADTHGGTRVVTPPSFPEGKGAEYSTFRNYTLAVEGDMIVASTTLLSWIEAVTFSGGGAQFGYLEPISGAPQRQLLKAATTYKAAQRGEATGVSAYPTPPDPIWPAAEHAHLRQIIYELPRRTGASGSAMYIEYKVRWSYVFENDTALSGSPTSWPS